MRGRAGRATAGLPAVLLAAVGALVGCTADGPAGIGSSSVDGLRSDPDHRGLVASYTGGACDGRARLVVTESRDRVEAEVEVRESGGACPSVGIARTVSARLDEPLGDRTVWVGGREHVPFDGARLLAPSALPAGFPAVTEMGSTAPSDAAAAGPVVTTTWIRVHHDVRPGVSDSCEPTRGTVEVRMQPASTDPARGRTEVGTVRVRGAEARLYRDGTSRRPSGWAYAWTRDRLGVVVSTSVDCDEDRPLDRAELLAFAESLGPL